MSRTWILLSCLLAMPLQAAVDPTRPQGMPALQGNLPAAELAPLRLQAILRGPAAVTAVINDQRLKAGEQAGDLRVLRIDSRSVLIERQGVRQRLTLAPQITVSRH